MTVYDFLVTVASALGDARPGSEFRRYPLRDLLTYYNEAMCFIAAQRRDLFTKRVVVKLEPGTTQDATCCGCSDVVGVMAQVTSDGVVVKDLSQASAASAQTWRWYRAPCRATPDGAAVPIIQAVGIEPGMAGVFNVFPPIPPGVDTWAVIKCVAPPRAVTEAQALGGVDEAGETVPPAGTGWCTFLPAVRSYVLYRALLGDRHATGASAEAARELKAVYDYLGLQYRMEQALDKET
jgi:hypothetical protein